MYSATFFAAPTNGTALRPVSNAPLITPFRRIVEAAVATAIAAPTHGIDRAMRRETRAPPHLAMRSVILMPSNDARRVPPASQPLDEDSRPDVGIRMARRGSKTESDGADRESTRTSGE